MEVTSVESLCNLLARSRLLPADDVRTLRKRWLREGGKSAGSVSAFTRWLVANQYVTEYQTKLLVRGKIERFFLSEYKLLDRIGKGRMAGVYKAIHRLGQVVAIKVLPPSKVKDAQIFGRFQREARLAVRLKHPHVVRTFQTGEDSGLHYIVMEYLEGQTLDELLAQRGKLPAAEALPILLQALYGLQYLHQQDIVHRDLKPANLMLLPTLDAAGHSALSLKILDIGLGRALFDERDSRGGEGLELTTEGALLGDPDYMAPEQARDAHAADIRSDLYSLGCVLYHMLTGQPPFPDTNRVRKLVRQATETPRPLKDINPQAPEGLQPILDALLAKDPAQRYATPESAIKAVLGLLGALTVPPPTAPVAIPVSPSAAPAAAHVPSVPMAVPVHAAAVPPPALVVAPPTSELVFDPIANMPSVRQARGGWKEALKLDRRDLVVFGLGLFGGLFALGIALLVVYWLLPRNPPN